MIYFLRVWGRHYSGKVKDEKGRPDKTTSEETFCIPFLKADIHPRAPFFLSASTLRRVRAAVVLPKEARRGVFVTGVGPAANLDGMSGMLITAHGPGSPGLQYPLALLKTSFGGAT